MHLITNKFIGCVAVATDKRHGCQAWAFVVYAAHRIEKMGKMIFGPRMQCIQGTITMTIGNNNVVLFVSGKMFLPEYGRDVLLSHGNDVFHLNGMICTLRR